MAMQLQDTLATFFAEGVPSRDNRFGNTPFEGVDSKTLALAQKIDASLSKMRGSCNFYVKHQDFLDDDIMTVLRLNPDIADQLAELSIRSRFNDQPFKLLRYVVLNGLDLYSKETLQKVER